MWFIILVVANILIRCNCDNILQVLMEKENKSGILPRNDCGRHLQTYIEGLISKKLWAIKMMDATAKIQSGYMEGNFYHLGNFDECLSIDQDIGITSVQGQYCLASISLTGLDLPVDLNLFDGFVEGIQPPDAPQFQPQVGICLPASCNASEMNSILQKLSIHRLTFNDLYCQTKSTGLEWTFGDIVTLCIAAIFAVVITVSTLYDTYNYYSESPRKVTTKAVTGFVPFTGGVIKMLKMIIKHCFRVNKNVNQLSCLAGIRTISLMWVVLAHGYIMISYLPYTNYLEVYKWAKRTSSMFIFSAPLSVDTFFLLSGTLLVYVFQHSYKNFSIKQVPLLYLHRYLRIAPALLAIVVVHLTVIKHVGSGPLWSFTSSITGNCEKDWWRVMLFVRNFGEDVHCIPVSWYLTCDMQLFFLSPLLLIPLQKHPRLTIKVVVGLIFCSILYSFWTAWQYDVSPFVIDNIFYTSPLRRICSWFIGILLGYFIHDYQTKATDVKMNKFLVIFLWMASFMVMLACIFCGNYLVFEPQLHKLENILHMGLVKPAWSIAVSWIIFACIFGYGGSINTFLSLPVFQILSKLGYCMYLLHFSILLVVNMSTRSAVVESNSREMHAFWSNYMITAVLSIVWTLSFESPVIALEKYILREKKHTSKEDLKEDKNEI